MRGRRIVHYSRVSALLPLEKLSMFLESRLLIYALHNRTSLRGLFVIVDSRRVLTPADEGLLAWALPAHRVHVLLSKADKLNRGEAAAVLRAAAATLCERATAQLFSALKGTGVAQAQDTLAAWLAGS